MARIILLVLLFVFAKPVYYSQNDPEWGKIVMTCNNGTSSTFDDVGCGETVVAMLMSSVDTRYTPEVVVDEIYGHEWCRGTGKQQNADVLKSQGFTVIPVLGDVEDYFWSGWNIVGYVPGHYILIVGMRNGEYAIYDPDHGVGFSGEDKFPYDKSDIVLLYAVKHREAKNANAE